MNQLIIEIEKINAMPNAKTPFNWPRGMMSIYTVDQVAEMEHCRKSQVTYFCRNNQVKKLANTGIFIMSMEDIEAFRNRRGKGWLKGQPRK